MSQGAQLAGLAQLVTASEDWLLRQVIDLAQERGYTRYASTQASAWRQAVRGLSQALTQLLAATSVVPELDPEDDHQDDPAAAFGIREAQRHRARGVTIELFLGLMKYFRQAYVDLVLAAGLSDADGARRQRFVERFFDRVEIGFCVEWTRFSESARLAELEAGTRWMTDQRTRYLTVFESLDQPVLLLDLAQRVVNANRVAARVFAGTEVTGAMHGGEAALDRVIAVLAEPLATLAAGRRDEGSHHANLETVKGLRHFSVKLRRLRDSADQPVGTVAIFDDVTEHHLAEQERRRLEERRQRAERLESLGQMAGAVARDFNNGLTVIVGNADIALGEVPAGTPAHDCLLAVLQAAEHLGRLTTQMHAFAGGAAPAKAPLDLPQLVRSCVGDFRLQLPPSLEVGITGSAALPALAADPQQVREVLECLLRNAIEAIGDHVGRVTVDLALAEVPPSSVAEADDVPSGRYCCLTVADTGGGMDEATRRRAFDPFFTTKVGGRGLGLSAVQGIVANHGGQVTLRSTAGRGTTVRVWLPLPTTPETAPAAPDETATAPTVLVVDDEEAVLSVTMRVLRRAGFGVLGAPGGREALDLLGDPANQISAVLLDLAMPGMGGEAVLREIRSSGLTLPVVLTSGYNHGEAALDSFHGANAFLHKPYAPAELASLLRRCLSADGGK